MLTVKGGMALPTAPTASSRSHLSKSLTRLSRTARTEFRLFLAKPGRRRPWTVPCLALLAVLAVVALVALVMSFFFNDDDRFGFTEPNREEGHFKHRLHRRLPRQHRFHRTHLGACSWLYLEFNAKDGRHLDGFFDNGSGFMEDYLRATQASMRGFCAIAFDGNPRMDDMLMQVRKVRGRNAYRMHVYTGIVPGARNGTEKVQLKNADDPSQSEAISVKSIDIADAVERLTFPYNQSGKDNPHMHNSAANGNKGTTVVRLNTPELREAYWHLDVLQAGLRDGLMCDRIDRLVINLARMELDDSNIAGDQVDQDVVRDWDSLIPPPSSNRFDPKNGVDGLVALAKEINERDGCRTVVHVVNEKGEVLWPKILSDRGVFYAVLAGAPTFDERVEAQTKTWISVVPKDRLTIFTNEERNAAGLKAARGWRTEVVHPHKPELEQRLPLMQSWSHLVRVRESWDRYMKDDRSIKWLALVDDDTFVFPGGMREYLSFFDPRQMLWGGHGEQARIDNGDSGKFASMLRDQFEARGGKHCYFPHENIPKDVDKDPGVDANGKKKTKPSHLCKDTFCSAGCSGVPQGAAILVSRALVQELRPHLETCEVETSTLCKDCGSQRLYMCVNFYVRASRTLLMRGICRAPWKLERRDKFPFTLTFHGFTRFHGYAMGTDSLRGDMQQLWELGQPAEERVEKGLASSYFVATSKIQDLIGCDGKGTYKEGKCIGKDGKEFTATDKPHKNGHKPFVPKGNV